MNINNFHKFLRVKNRIINTQKLYLAESYKHFYLGKLAIVSPPPPPRDASYKIFNWWMQPFDFARRQCAPWDDREDCKRVTEIGRGRREYKGEVPALFGSYKTWVWRVLGSLDSTYLDPCNDNAAGTIGRRRRSEVLEVELDRRWDQGLACYWWPGPSARR